MNNRGLLDEIVAREMPQMEVLMEKVRQEKRFYRSTTAGRGFNNGMLINPTFGFLGDERNCDRKIAPDLHQNFTASVHEEDGKRAATPPSSEINFRPGNQVQTNLKASGIKSKLEEIVPAAFTDQSSADIPNKSKAKDYRNFKENPGNMKSFPAKKTRLNRPSQNWSCAICKINTSSEINLHSHLQGKMHKSNLKYHKRCRKIKTVGDRLELVSSPGQAKSVGNAVSTAGNSSSSVRIGSKDDENSAPLSTVSPDRSDRVSSEPLKKTAAVAETETGELDGEVSEEETMAFSNDAMRMKMQVDGVLHEVVQAGGFLWCELCRLQFRGTAMMANHLGGNAHVTAGSESLNSDRSV